MSPDKLDAAGQPRPGRVLSPGDVEGARVLLAHGDLRTMTAFLASVVDDLVGDRAEWWRLSPDDVLARLRAHHAGEPG